MNTSFLYVFINIFPAAFSLLLACNVVLSFLIAVLLGRARDIGLWKTFFTGVAFSAAVALVVTLLFKTKKRKPARTNLVDQFPDSGLIAYHIRKLKLLNQSGVISKTEFEAEINRVLHEETLH